MPSDYCIYSLNKLPIRNETMAAIPPIVKVINPDLIGDLSTTFPLINPMENNEIAVNNIE